MENNFGMPSAVVNEKAQEEEKIFTPEEQTKIDEHTKETTELIETIASRDFNKKSKLEQLKIFTKVKILFGILALAGVSIAAVSFGHLDDVRDLPETVIASKEAIREGWGIAMTVFGGMGAGLTHAIYKNEKKNI